MSNSETETIQAAAPANRAAVLEKWPSRHLANAKPLIWPAKGPGRPLALLRAVPTADHPRPSLSLAAVVGRLSPTPMPPEPEFHDPCPSCSVATRITVGNRIVKSATT